MAPARAEIRGEGAIGGRTVSASGPVEALPGG